MELLDNINKIFYDISGAAHQNLQKSKFST